MSKHHQSSRRKSYGRRQHEVRERHDRNQQPEGFEAEFGERSNDGAMDSYAFLDPRAPRLRLMSAD